MCIYGYARISTKKQNIERQIRNILLEYPTAKIYQEVYTGTKFQSREILKKLINEVKEGDTIVFDSVSRMSRNAKDGIKQYFELYEQGINLVFLKERYIDTDTFKRSVAETIGETGNEIADIYIGATNKVIRILASKQIEKAFEQAQKEVDDLQQRTREGIETARRNGKLIGGSVTKGKRKNTKLSIESKEKILKHSKSFGGTMTNKELMDYCRISEPTLLKYKKEIRSDLIMAREME